jgi:hypothetical protein
MARTGNWLSALSRGFDYLTLDPSPRLRALREQQERERLALIPMAINADTGERTPLGRPLPPLPTSAYGPLDHFRPPAERRKP